MQIYEILEKDHDEVRRMLSELVAKPDSESPIELVKKSAIELQTAVEQHIEEEQGPVFALAREYFTTPEAEAVGRAFEKMKAEVVGAGLMKTSFELVANLMPPRFTERFRSFRIHEQAG